MKLLTIKLKNSEYIVNDYFTRKPTSPYSEYNMALDLCRMRLERSIYEVMHEIKVPFISLWLVW
jgi:hypothetical protein